jgi:ribosome recycling factor
MQYNFSDLKNKLKKTEEFLSKEYLQISTGRASPIVLDSISVEIYGTYQPIKNIASISIEDPRILRVTPWDKSQIKLVEKAILMADLGLSVSVDENGIRIIFPQLTTETRQKLAKILKDKLEEARISVRKERDYIWNDIQNQERDGKITKDDKFRAKEDLQKIIDEINRKLEALFEKKEKEVMG